MKIPRKAILKESPELMIWVHKFWEEFGDDFPHINLENIAFVRDDPDNMDEASQFMKIIAAPYEVRLLLPDIHFMLLVYPSFNVTPHEDRIKKFYECFFSIPRNYLSLNEPRLKKPDFQGFYAVMEKFKKMKGVI